MSTNVPSAEPAMGLIEITANGILDSILDELQLPKSTCKSAVETNDRIIGSNQVMDLGFNIPSDEFLGEWLKDDRSVLRDAVESVCFLSRRDRKVRRIKDHLQNYIFVTEAGIDFDINQLRSVLSMYLHLDYGFQFLQVEQNKFILTLETHRPVDYACAVLEEGSMIHFADSNITYYPTDEHAEGYFGGDLGWNMDDEVADMHIDVQIHALPLHLRTVRAIERILLRYCVVYTVNDDCLSSKNLDCISCDCWTQRGIIFPKFMIVTVFTKFSRDSAFLSGVGQKHVQTYCVAIVVKLHGLPHREPKYQLHDNRSFARAAESDRVGYCFLRDVDVSVARINELQDSIILVPKQLGLQNQVEEISAALQSTTPHINGNSGRLTVQSIGVQGYIAKSVDFSLPQHLHKMIGVGNKINLCSQAFSWFPWSTSFGAVKESLTKKISIRTSSLPTECLTPTVIEDLLSPFCMFDSDGYHPGSSPDIHDYRTVVWSSRNVSIPPIIFVYASPPFCETTVRPEGKVVELTVMKAYNRGEGLRGQGRKDNFTIMCETHDHVFPKNSHVI